MVHYMYVMVAALFGVQNLLFPGEIPLLPISFLELFMSRTSFSPLATFVAHFVRTGLKYTFL